MPFNFFFIFNKLIVLQVLVHKCLIDINQIVFMNVVIKCIEIDTCFWHFNFLKQLISILLLNICVLRLDFLIFHLRDLRQQRRLNELLLFFWGYRSTSWSNNYGCLINTFFRTVLNCCYIVCVLIHPESTSNFPLFCHLADVFLLKSIRFQL